MTSETAFEPIGDVGVNDWEQIPDLMAIDSDWYLAEYGVRVDDGHLVIHVFPPGKHAWPGGWQSMVPVLESGIRTAFNVENVRASYETEVSSFCIIILGGGMVPDPFFRVHQFFAHVDELLRARA